MTRSEAIVTLRVLSPIAGAGAVGPELRESSIRGVLRWWYRVLNPGRPEDERGLFGGVSPSPAQSSWVRLRVMPDKDGDTAFRRVARDRTVTSAFVSPGPNEPRSYLGYFLQQRDAPLLKHATEVSVSCRAQAGHEDLRWHELDDAWWLLGHLGGVGARARRGYGGLGLARIVRNGVETSFPISGEGKQDYKARLAAGLGAVCERANLRRDVSDSLSPLKSVWLSNDGGETQQDALDVAASILRRCKRAVAGGRPPDYSALHLRLTAPLRLAGQQGAKRFILASVFASTNAFEQNLASMLASTKLVTQIWPHP